MLVTVGLTIRFGADVTTVELAPVQVNELADVTADNVEGEPAQTRVGLLAAVTGNGPTEMVVTAVVVPHPFWPLTV